MLVEEMVMMLLSSTSSCTVLFAVQFVGGVAVMFMLLPLLLSFYRRPLRFRFASPALAHPNTVPFHPRRCCCVPPTAPRCYRPCRRHPYMSTTAGEEGRAHPREEGGAEGVHEERRAARARRVHRRREARQDRVGRSRSGSPREDGGKGALSWGGRLMRLLRES